MQRNLISEVLFKKYLEFEYDIRETNSPLELVKVLATSLKDSFLIDGLGVIQAKKIGSKLLVEKEIMEGSYLPPEQFSQISTHIKESFELVALSDYREGKSSFICQIEEGNYSVNVVFSKDSYLHIMYFKTPEGVEESKDLNAFIKLFAHEWNWHQRLEDAHELIFQDDLTGLFNYRFLEQMLEREVARSNRFNHKFSLMFVDLDNFKSVNDTHGHLVGSDLLKKIAKEIQNAVREVDSVVRYGGDEFIVILLGANESQSMVIAERVRASIEQFRLQIEGSDSKVGVTASIGISCYPDHGQTKEELLSMADSNMYLSKESGKNCIHIHHNL